jgi:hypothetical protein
MGKIEQQVSGVQERSCDEIADTKWEQRRYEIAKDLYCQLLRNDNPLPNQIIEDFARRAVSRADTLISILKKTK